MKQAHDSHDQTPPVPWFAKQTSRTFRLGRLLAHARAHVVPRGLLYLIAGGTLWAAGFVSEVHARIVQDNKSSEWGVHLISKSDYMVLSENILEPNSSHEIGARSIFSWRSEWIIHRYSELLPPLNLSEHWFVCSGSKYKGLFERKVLAFTLSADHGIDRNFDLVEGSSRCPFITYVNTIAVNTRNGAAYGNKCFDARDDRWSGAKIMEFDDPFKFGANREVVIWISNARKPFMDIVADLLDKQIRELPRLGYVGCALCFASLDASRSRLIASSIISASCKSGCYDSRYQRKDRKYFGPPPIAAFTALMAAIIGWPTLIYYFYCKGSEWKLLVFGTIGLGLSVCGTGFLIAYALIQN